MTFKKSMISISAAAVIAAGLTGCGSSDSTTAGTTTTAPTSFEAVDGKIMNAVATATYWDEDANATDTVTLTPNPTTIDYSGATAVINKGTYAYTIPADSNVTADMIRYVTFTKQAQTTDPATGIVTPATFIDVDDSKDYNSSVDNVAITVDSLVATKGDAYASLASTMKFQAAGGTATYNVKEVNTTTGSAVQKAQAAVEALFGLSAGQLATLDPTQDKNFKFLNAQYGSLTTAELNTAATIVKDLNTSAVDLSSVEKIIAYAADTLTIPVFTTIKNGDFDFANLDKYNADKVRKSGGSPVLEEELEGTIGSITAITVNSGSTDVGTLKSTGDKLADADVKFTFATNEDTDTNSTKLVDLVLEVTNPRASVEAGANANKLLITLANVEVKKVEATTSLDINESTATISYKWTNLTDANLTHTGYASNVSFDDANLSSLGLTKAGIFTSNTFDISELISKIDTNASTEAKAADTSSFSTKIVTVKAGLVDAGNALQKVDSSTGDTLGWTSITANGVSAKPILTSATYDMRGTATGVNTAPAATAITPSTSTLDALVHLAADGTVTANEATEALSGATLVVNDIDAGDITKYLDITVSGDNNEKNDSVSISGLPTWITANNNNVKNGEDLNITIDGNASVSGHDTTMATINVKDEFGETNSSKDLNVSFMFNHAPVITAKTVSADINTTDGEDIITVSNTVSDADSTEDINGTNSNSSLDAVTIVGTYNINGAYVASATPTSVIVVPDENVTVDVAAALNANGTINWTLTANTDLNSDTTAAGEEGNITITYNVTDIYGATSTDKNITFDTNTTD